MPFQHPWLVGILLSALDTGPARSEVMPFDPPTVVFIGSSSFELWKLDHVSYVDMNTPMLGPKGNPRAGLFRIDGIQMKENGCRVWRDVLLLNLEPPMTAEGIPVSKPYCP